MDECKFAKEMKGNVLPTKKDVIGHYFFVRNRLMCNDAKYLHRRPEFNVCKDEVNEGIKDIWIKGCLPVMGKKSMETKLKNLLKQFAAAKARRTKLDLSQFENLFDVSTCKCNHGDIVEKYGRVCCKCSRENQIPIKDMVFLTKYYGVIQ